MLFKEAIDKWSGLRFMAEELELFSGVSRKLLYGRSLMTENCKIESELDAIAYWQCQLKAAEQHRWIQDIIHRLCEVVDIYGTIQHIEQGLVLDDIELFEIKHFLLVSEQLRLLLEKDQEVSLPNLIIALDLLDPEKQRLSAFYIYDCYDKLLSEQRKQLKATKEPDDELLESIQERENIVRRYLSDALKSYSDEIKEALDTVALIDLRLAIAKQALHYECCRPSLGTGQISYKGLFNVQLKVILGQQGKKYQPIDVLLDQRPILLTGINMGGKTVFLKTVALAQLLCQYGFYVPAIEAKITPVNAVLSSMSDAQNELDGLSSFAAEMVQIDGILKTIKKEGTYLVLVDELARTTNPIEGSAIVSAFLDLMSQTRNYCVVTSHYDKIKGAFRRMRVKGLQSDDFTTLADLNKLIDYSLIEFDSVHTPKEALKIAQMIGVDRRLVEKAQSLVELDKNIEN